MSEPTRILVIRFSSIGDIVLTTPVVRALQEQLDGPVEIHYLTKSAFSALLEHNPRIHRLHTIEKSVQEVLPALEQLNFDYIVDLHHNIRSLIVRRRLKSLAFVFDKLNFRKWLLVNFRIRRMNISHVVDRYLATLSSFGVQDDGVGLEYYLPKNLQPAQLPESHRSGYVALAIGGAHIGKKMDAGKIAALCSRVDRPIVLIGGREDISCAVEVTRSVGNHVYNAVGKLTLHESAHVVSEARVVVSGDTGMMHIAAAFGKKIVSLWGCTTPSLGMSPYRADPSSMVIEPMGRSRRPCSKLGDRCKYGENKRCIQQLDPAIISTAIETLWAQ